jgi:hypothetical protein
MKNIDEKGQRKKLMKMLMKKGNEKVGENG